MPTLKSEAQRLLYDLSKHFTPAELDSSVCALILTESYFRPVVFRLAELLFAAFYMLVMRRDPRTTIGTAQVGVAYWRELYPRSCSLLLASTSSLGNYRACCHHRRIKKGFEVSEILISYNGIPTRSYVERYLERLTAVKELQHESWRRTAKPH
jgi:hypothetical protein